MTVNRPDVPEDVANASTLIQKLKAKTYLSRSEGEELNRARLKVAFWACRAENVTPSRENLAYILGRDAASIMGAYDRYLEREDEKTSEREARRKKAKDSSQFWGGAK